MSPTNIHSESQVLMRAGRDMTDQAQFMPFGKPVLLVGREFVQEEIESFSAVLRTPHQDVWVEYNGSADPRQTTNDRGLPVPSLYTSPGVDEDIRHKFDGPKTANGEKVDLAFVIIVRGASAAKFSKVRAFYSYLAVAAGMVEEALQGWSVVFSAAMLKRDVQKLGRAEIEFEKVGKLSELIKSVDEERASTSVLLCC